MAVQTNIWLSTMVESNIAFSLANEWLELTKSMSSWVSSIDCSWTCHGWGCFWISSTTCKCYRHCRPPLPNVYTPTTCNDDGTTEDNNCHDSMENFSKLNIHPMTMTTNSLHKTCDYNNHEQHLDNPSTSFNCLQPSMQTLIAKMHWMHHLSWTKIYARVILENTYSPDHIWCSTFKAIKSQVHHKLNSMCWRTTKSSTSSYNMFLYPLIRIDRFNFNLPPYVGNKTNTRANYSVHDNLCCRFDGLSIFVDCARSLVVVMLIWAHMDICV